MWAKLRSLNKKKYNIILMQETKLYPGNNENIAAHMAKHLSLPIFISPPP